MSTKNAQTTSKTVGPAKHVPDSNSSRPFVSLDPRDYFYPTSAHGASVWGVRLEQAYVNAAERPAAKFARASSGRILSDSYTADDTVLDTLGSDELTDPSNSFECLEFDSLPENSEKSSNTRNSPRRTTVVTKSGLRSSGAVKAITDDDEGPEMLVTASSGLLGLMDPDIFGSGTLASNIVNLKRGRKLSLSLNHEATAACINNVIQGDVKPTATVALAPAAGKLPVEPSNSCQSSQSPCDVAGLQAC